MRSWQVRAYGPIGASVAAADHDVDASPDRAPRVPERFQAARALGDDDAAGALHPVLDRDLTRRGGVEPGDRLVGADEERPLAPQVLDLLLAELVSARRAGGDDAHAIRVVLGRIELGVVERHLRRREGHPGPAVGLDDQPLIDVVRRLEAVDLAGELGRVLGRVEAGDRPDAALALHGGLPPGLGADAVRRDDAESGDDRTAGGGVRSAHAPSPCSSAAARRSSPTESRRSRCPSRARRRRAAVCATFGV